MRDATVLFIHGFWSSPATWDRVAEPLESDTDLSTLRFERFGYRSPKLSLPLLPARVPDLDDVAQDLAGLVEHQLSDGPLAVVTHSQGGLVLQRYLAWMVNEGRSQELDRLELAVLLACPNDGSEYLASLRGAAGFGRHPQARDLRTLSADVAGARRTVLHRTEVPVHAYSGSSDNVVKRSSGQGAWRHVGSLPGDHFSILDPELPGSLTVPTLKSLLTKTFDGEPPRRSPTIEPGQGTPKYGVTFNGPSSGVVIGDHNVQHNAFGTQQRDER
jgi:pimeloyl-ACP methyl ester carboxylesterase